VVKSSQKKLLALDFSPRKRSNSSRLLDFALKSAIAEGIGILRYKPHEMNIAPCDACETCYDGSPCPKNDDMAEIYPILETANAVIIATPSYFYGVPAPAKALIDRCQLFWARKYILAETLPSRPAGVIEVAGSGGQRVFEGINLTIKYFLDSISIDMPEPLAFRHVDCDPKDLPDELLRASEEYGTRLVSEILKEEKNENR